MNTLGHPNNIQGCVGILLAGGYGRRYAQAAEGVDKLWARLPDGRRVVEASAQAMLAALPRVWAVVRPESRALADCLASLGCRVIETERAREGMGGSLAEAARVLMEQGAVSGFASGSCELPRASAMMTRAVLAPVPAFTPVSRFEPASPPMPVLTHCLVSLADMPWIQPASHARVAAVGHEQAIVAAAFQGRRGHPVSFTAALWPELAALTGDEGARGLLARHGVTVAQTGDPGVLADVDHPDDLTRAHG